MKILRGLYLTGRFFGICGLLVLLFCISFAWSVLFPIAQGIGILFILFLISDLYILFSLTNPVRVRRDLSPILSLGDQNTIDIDLSNEMRIPLYIELTDELPAQFQMRNFNLKFLLKAMERRTVKYDLNPVQRGEYWFGNTNVYINSRLRLAERRLIQKGEEMIPVYPSVIQMKKYELISLSKVSTFQGIKKLRRLGHSYEFEQIKNYVKGDDYRSINWKATSRKNELMVNQYQDERSQQVYTLLDSSRSMQMPFGGMSLLDYSINSTLVLSNIILKRQDKTGLLSFADKIQTVVKAESHKNQLHKIMEALYAQESTTTEANFELLYSSVRQFIKVRSMVMLFSNFESLYAMQRVAPLLRKINNLHLLVVIIFENTELSDYSFSPAKNIEEIYHKTIAQKFVSEKNQIIQELRQHGIQCILSRPEDLSIKTINKYFELKARGMI